MSSRSPTTSRSPRPSPPHGLTLALGGSTLTGLNGIVLSNGQAWQSLGFAVGQKVYVPGQGVRTIIGFANGTGANADGLPLDGAVLLVDGAAFTTATLTGTVSLTSRYRFTGALTETGTTRTPAPFRCRPARSQRRASPSASRSGSSGVNGPRTIVSIGG